VAAACQAQAELARAEAGQVGALADALDAGIEPTDPGLDDLRAAVARAERVRDASALVVRRRAAAVARVVEEHSVPRSGYLRDRIDELDAEVEAALRGLYAAARARHTLIGAATTLDRRYSRETIDALELPPGHAPRYRLQDATWLTTALTEALTNAPGYFSAFDPRQPAIEPATASTTTTHQEV
jgi:hypothetical protein